MVNYGKVQIRFSFMNYEEFIRWPGQTKPYEANNSKFIELVHLQCVTICFKNVKRGKKFEIENIFIYELEDDIILLVH